METLAERQDFLTGIEDNPRKRHLSKILRKPLHVLEVVFVSLVPDPLQPKISDQKASTSPSKSKVHLRLKRNHKFGTFVYRAHLCASMFEQDEIKNLITSLQNWLNEAYPETAAYLAYRASRRNGDAR